MRSIDVNPQPQSCHEAGLAHTEKDKTKFSPHFHGHEQKMASQDMNWHAMLDAYAWNTRKKHLQKMGKNFHRCCLCDSGTFHGNSARSHFLGRPHRAKVSAVLSNSNLSLADMRRVRSRISSLGLARWRNHMQELLLQHNIF